MDLHQRKREFKGWTRKQTAQFANVFYRILDQHTYAGFEFSVLKSTFEANKSAYNVERQSSPIGGALDRLLSLNPGSVQVITRFNLVDFAEGVSDVAGLRMLLDAGAQVRGIRRLHAKLYLSASWAIITSATSWWHPRVGIEPSRPGACRLPESAQNRAIAPFHRASSAGVHIVSAVGKIRDGTITRYVYDATSASLVARQ